MKFQIGDTIYSFRRKVDGTRRQKLIIDIQDDYYIIQNEDCVLHREHYAPSLECCYFV